jgi:hypothetical protein
MPKLGHFLTAYLTLGTPRDHCVWLNTECSHGHAIPIGKFIEVPNKIVSWKEIANLLKQVDPLPGIGKEFDQRYLFGFLMGMIIGDSSKSGQGKAHRHLGLSLSKKYATN